MTDLDSFFAKKKDKKKSKTIQMDALNSTMDRKIKKQEEMERAEQEELANGGEYTGADDGEWIDYDNLSGNRVVEGLAINTMNLEDVEEEAPEEHEEHEAEPKEQAKTWATIEKKAVDPEIIPSDQDLKDAKAPSSRYVPPGRAAPANAWGVVGGGGKIDLNNQEMFPTFAAAEQIEKHKKDDVKNAWTTAGANQSSGGAPKPNTYQPPGARGSEGGAWRPSASARSEKDDVMAAARSIGATAAARVAPAAAAAAPTPIKPPAPAPAPELNKAKNAYVPPHLRAQNK